MLTTFAIIVTVVLNVLLVDSFKIKYHTMLNEQQKIDIFHFPIHEESFGSLHPSCLTELTLI